MVYEFESPGEHSCSHTRFKIINYN